jgi:uncharacterized coiled-coil DUF342 family protein
MNRKWGDMSQEGYSPNWQQDLIDRIGQLEDKLEDSKVQIGANSNVKNTYSEAITKVKDAREAINRLAAVFNYEYRAK